MLKSILSALLLILVLMHNQSYANASEGMSLRLGAKAGLNLAKVSGDNAKFGIEGTQLSIEPENKLGFAGGLFLNIKFMDYFSIQPEMLYSMKGAEYKKNIPTPVQIPNPPYLKLQDKEYKFTFGINYFEIPILLELIILSMMI